jgi:hypothetical protein
MPQTSKSSASGYTIWPLRLVSRMARSIGSRRAAMVRAGSRALNGPMIAQPAERNHKLKSEKELIFDHQDAFAAQLPLRFVAFAIGDVDPDADLGLVG